MQWNDFIFFLEKEDNALILKTNLVYNFFVSSRVHSRLNLGQKKKLNSTPITKKYAILVLSCKFYKIPLDN